MRIRILILAMVAGIASLLVPMAPASADPAVCAFTGTATLGVGIINTQPTRQSDFSFSAGTAICTNGVNSVSGSGVLQGFCGHSTVGILDGTHGNADVAGHQGSIMWVSVGTLIIIVSPDMVPPTVSTTAAVAVVNARVAGADPANGVLPCVTHTAHNFDVVGVAAVVHVI